MTRGYLKLYYRITRGRMDDEGRLVVDEIDFVNASVEIEGQRIWIDPNRLVGKGVPSINLDFELPYPVNKTETVKR